MKKEYKFKAKFWYYSKLLKREFENEKEFYDKESINLYALAMNYTIVSIEEIEKTIDSQKSIVYTKNIKYMKQGR